MHAVLGRKKLFLMKEWKVEQTKMRNTTLVFLRSEHAEVSNIGILNLKTSLISDSEVKKALIDATTHWVNTTDEGRSLWDYSCGDMNIGDLASSSAFESTDFLEALKERGIEYIACTLGDCESALSYDEILVDESEVVEMTQKLQNS